MKRLYQFICICLSLFLPNITLFAAELHLYSGAGLREPVEEIIKKFEKTTGHHVIVEYGGMGQLLTRFSITKTGDVFFSGSLPYVEQLDKDNYISQQFPVTRHTAVLAVSRAKGAYITSIEQLAKSQLRLGMGDPQAIALGKSGEVLLDKSGYGDALRKKVIVRATTIKQLLLYLLNGDVDAAVIGHSDAVRNADKLLILPTPAGTPEEISTIAVLKTSKHPEAALELAKFFILPENLAVFTDYGFLPLDARAK